MKFHLLGILGTLALAVGFFGAETPDATADDTPFGPYVRPGWFFEIAPGASFRFGSSNTTDGGAWWGGGGVARDVEFDTAFAFRAVVGATITPNLAASLSYDLVDGEANWLVDFPAFNSYGNIFNANARSHVLMANIGYTSDLDATTHLTANAGLGVSFNQLDGILEMNSRGQFGAQLASSSNTSLAASAKIGIERDITGNISFGTTAEIARYGTFKTGDSRTFPVQMVQEPIGAYELNNVWGAAVSLYLKVRLN